MLAKKRRFSYRQRQYSNPFFSRNNREVRSGRKWLKKAIFLLILAAIFALIWFFYFSSYFEIKNFKINGLNRVSGPEIENLFWSQTDEKKFFSSQKNIFLFDSDKFIASINNNYSFISVELKNDLPDAFILGLKEREPIAIWNEDGNNFLIDNEGYIIVPASQADFDQKMPIIENHGSDKISNKRTGVGQEKNNFILNIFTSFKDSKIDHQIEKIFIENDLDTIKVLLFDAPFILLNSKGELDKQIEKISALYKDMSKDEFAKKEYYDLRYGDRVYYK